MAPNTRLGIDLNFKLAQAADEIAQTKTNSVRCHSALPAVDHMGTVKGDANTF